MKTVRKLSTKIYSLGQLDALMFFTAVQTSSCTRSKYSECVIRAYAVNSSFGKPK